MRVESLCYTLLEREVSLRSSTDRAVLPRRQVSNTVGASVCILMHLIAWIDLFIFYTPPCAASTADPSIRIKLRTFTTFGRTPAGG